EPAAQNLSSDIDDAKTDAPIEPENPASGAYDDEVAQDADDEAETPRDESSFGSAPSEIKSAFSTLTLEKKDQGTPLAVRPLAPRLPSREDRLLLTGKRALATPELRDTLRRLAPAFPPDGETPSDAVARLEKIVAKVDPDHVAKIE